MRAVRIIGIAIFLGLALLGSAARGEEKEALDELARINAHMRDELLKSATPPPMAPQSTTTDVSPGNTPVTPRTRPTANDFYQALREDGSFPDQDYTDRNREKWGCGEHLPRLLSITVAYVTPGTPLSRKERARDKILAGLQFWLDKSPTNENWWHADIGVPQLLGEILILLGPACPTELRQRATDLMDHAKNWQTWTGANLADGAMIQLQRACLIQSPELARIAFDRMWKEIKVSGPGENEGIQADWTFHQHGPLLLGDSYATVFLNNAMRFLRIANGTSHAPPPETVDVIADFICNSEMWMIRGANFDFGVCGRSITRASGTGTRGFAEYLTDLAQFPGAKSRARDTNTKTRLNALSDPHSSPIGNRHFWKSDYMVHRQDGFFASIRMYSSRVWNTDGLINGENKKTHHIADGANCFMITGAEYRGIYPVWDWSRIPGTTVEQNQPMVPSEVQRKSPSDFVGGVSDGQYGCAAMQLQYDQLSAKKAWFCFDDQIVCLGTDIQCSSSNPVYTTLNQCFWQGPVFRATNELSRGTYPLGNSRWVWHNNIGYLFLESANATVQLAEQSGAWSDIGAGSNAPLKSDVFSLWIDHGTNVKDGHYAYIVMPGADVRKFTQAAQNLSIVVLSNTPQLQAVANNSQNIVEAVFHQPGEMQLKGWSIRVDQPCLLVLRTSPTGVSLTLSNPLNKGGVVNVQFSRLFYGKSVSPIPGGCSASVVLPEGVQAGKSVSVSLDLREQR